MAYAQLQSTAIRHRKVRVLSHQAFRVWVAGLCYAQENLTDGVIYEATTDGLGVPVSTRVIGELLTGPFGPLWSVVDQEKGVYRIHDYTDWNRSREEVLRSQGLSRARQQSYRDRRFTRHASGNGSTDASPDASPDAPHNASQDAPDNASRDGPRNAARNATASQRISTHLISEDCASGAVNALRDASQNAQPPPDGEAFRQVSLVARVLLRQFPHDSDADIRERVKAKCAEISQPYDARTVAKAIDSERFKARRGDASKARNLP